MSLRFKRRPWVFFGSRKWRILCGGGGKLPWKNWRLDPNRKELLGILSWMSSAMNSWTPPQKKLFPILRCNLCRVGGTVFFRMLGWILGGDLFPRGSCGFADLVVDSAGVRMGRTSFRRDRSQRHFGDESVDASVSLFVVPWGTWIGAICALVCITRCGTHGCAIFGVVRASVRKVWCDVRESPPIFLHFFLYQF